jgi:hypothetical protein
MTTRRISIVLAVALAALLCAFGTACTSAPSELPTNATPQDVAKRYIEELRDGRTDAAAKLALPGLPSGIPATPAKGQAVTATAPSTLQKAKVAKLLAAHPEIVKLGVGPDSEIAILGVFWDKGDPLTSALYVLLARPTPNDPWRVAWVGATPPS